MEGGQAFCRGLERSQIRLLTTDLRGEYGAFMKPSGRNQWQPVANEQAPKTPETSQNRCRGGCDPSPLNLDVRNAMKEGLPRSHAPRVLERRREGVDGSSPSEGSAKSPLMGGCQYVFSRS